MLSIDNTLTDFQLLDLVKILSLVCSVISLSRHEQVCLVILRFQGNFSHHCAQ